MLHQPISQVPSAGALDEPAAEDADQAMNVLQYGTALFAIIFVVILAAFH